MKQLINNNLATKINSLFSGSIKPVKIICEVENKYSNPYRYFLVNLNGIIKAVAYNPENNTIGMVRSRRHSNELKKYYN